MVRRGHQAHAERSAEHQRIKVLAVLAIGEARHPHQNDEREGEGEQKQAEEHGHRIVHEHAREQLLPRDRASRQTAGGYRKVKRDRRPESASTNESIRRMSGSIRASNITTIVAQIISSGMNRGRLTRNVSDISESTSVWSVTTIVLLSR